MGAWAGARFGVIQVRFDMSTTPVKTFTGSIPEASERGGRDVDGGLPLAVQQVEVGPGMK